MKNDESRKYRKFLKRLKSQRLARGKTQVDVAEALDKPQSFVSKIEGGERRLDVLELKAFAELYSVSVDWLLDISVRKRR
jgi:transcriptional regulator with XRE-family HTH domain